VFTFCGFQKNQNERLANLLGSGMEFIITICIPNNNVLLVTLENFEPHPMLVNVNKLNPYMYVEGIIKPQPIV